MRAVIVCRPFLVSDGSKNDCWIKVGFKLFCCHSEATDYFEGKRMHEMNIIGYIELYNQFEMQLGCAACCGRVRAHRGSSSCCRTEPLDILSGGGGGVHRQASFHSPAAGPLTASADLRLRLRLRGARRGVNTLGVYRINILSCFLKQALQDRESFVFIEYD